MSITITDGLGNVVYTGDSVTVSGPLTDTELRAEDVKVSLDGESVAVTGPLTDTQLRASDVKVSLDSETVTVTGPLTDTQLRTAPVPVSGTVTSELSATDNAVLDDIASNQTDASQKTQLVDGSGNVIGSNTNHIQTASKWVDTDGSLNGFLNAGGKPRVSATQYTYDIAHGYITDHTNWSKIGYTPTMNTSESDVWSAAGVYTFPTSAAGMEVVSSDNTQDIGTVIKGDATGNTVQADAGGSTTTIIDADVDFTASTAVAAGDIVILDPHGTNPEWGYVTSVDTHTITCSGGFSSGGTGASRYYAIIDYSAHSGALAVKVEYLNASFAQKSEIIVLNGTTVVPTVNLDLYRINSFRVIAAGSGFKSVGNLSIRNLSDTPIYSYIIAGYTRARNVIYTVPTGKTLYVHTVTASFGYAANQTHYCRLYTKANLEPSTKFNTGNLFYTFSEVIVANTIILLQLTSPTKLPAGTDLRVSGISSVAGIAQCSLRGWLE